MTERDAIEYLLGRYLVVGSKCNPPEDQCKKHNEVVDMAIEALKKQVPNRYKNRSGSVYACVRCGTCYITLNYGQKYCDNCGQAIDWSDYDE